MPVRACGAGSGVVGVVMMRDEFDSAIFTQLQASVCRGDIPASELVDGAQSPVLLKQLCAAWVLQRWWMGGGGRVEFHGCRVIPPCCFLGFFTARMLLGTAAEDARCLKDFHETC